jgi:hypothetical protein
MLQFASRDTHASQVQPETLAEPGFPVPSLREELRARLKSEIDEQARKADLNLVLGAATATVGIGILVWLAFSAGSINAGTAGARPPIPMVYYGMFIARGMLSLTANTFAFFFLSTYRRNLSEVKYFQNELSNVELKLLALDAAVGANMRDAVKKIATILASTERNFVLRRGETTADLSLKDLDRAEIQTLLSVVARSLNVGHDEGTATRRAP